MMNRQPVSDANFEPLPSPSRRGFLWSATAAGVLLPAFLRGVARAGNAVGSPGRPLKLAWNAGATCLSGVALAEQNGIFRESNLNVELVNFSGSTDQLLESIATGKADAAVGMALRWLKPLEQGFDVKITGGLHGGCLRLFGSKAAGVTGLAALKGKTIAVADMGSPAKNFFSVVLVKQGLDPTKDVEWRQYPGNLLGLAVEKGEAQALADNDPITWPFRKDAGLVELATNLTGEYHDRTCCLIGVRGSLVREDRGAAQRLTEALFHAWHIVAAAPEAAATAFQPYAPKFSHRDLVEMLQSHNHHQQVVGDALRAQIVQYVEELKIAQVFKPSTDAVKFAQRVTVDVLA
jgi:NitT/TauT family transport system substrate-binding protein